MHKNEIVVSVILPTYNDEKFISHAIDSIIAQSFKNWELIVVDDGSDDGTSFILESFSDFRIKIVRNSSNLGIVKSLNKGIALARGKYIARMDGDDICHPERFKRQVKFLENNHDISVLGTFSLIIDDNGKSTKKIWTTSLESPMLKVDCLFGCPLCHPSIMIKREILQKLEYDLRFTLSEDYDLFSRFLDKYKASTIEDILLYYRIHKGNRSLEKSNTQKRQTKTIMRRELEKYGLFLKDDDMNNYMDLFFHTGQTYSFQKLISIRNWLIKIKVHNRKKHYLEPKSLARHLKRKYLIFCIRNDGSNKVGAFFFFLFSLDWNIYSNLTEALHFINQSKRMQNLLNNFQTKEI